jgi:hypothetical protein
LSDEQGTGTPSTTPGEQQATAGAEPSPTSVQTTALTDTAPTTPPAEVPAEDYTFEMPEGIDLDKAGVDEFTAIAKELKLPKDAADKLVGLEVKRLQKAQQDHVSLVESWAEQVNTDQEIGGDKLAENLAVARKAVDAFGSPGLKDLLNSTGLGNHPEVVKAFFKAGKAISEDGFVRGAPKSPATESDLAKSLFPSMNR